MCCSEKSTQEKKRFGMSLTCKSMTYHVAELHFGHSSIALGEGTRGDLNNERADSLGKESINNNGGINLLFACVSLLFACVSLRFNVFRRENGAILLHQRMKNDFRIVV
jgi:hypothetical protein